MVRADEATGQSYLGFNKSGSMLAVQLTARPGPAAGGQAAELPVERLATAEDFTSAVKEGGAGQAEHGATRIALDGGTSHWRDCHFADVPSPSINCVNIETPTKGRGGCSRIIVSLTARRQTAAHPERFRGRLHNVGGHAGVLRR